MTRFTYRRMAILATLLLLAPPLALGFNRYWIGNGGNWNSAANWSAVSGGTGNATVPGTSDIAIFDGSSGPCTINTNASVAGLQLQTGFVGTVTQSDDATVQVGASHYIQDAGTFLGGTKSFTMAAGNFTVNAGDFRAGSGQVLVFSQRFAVPGARFTAGTSFIRFETASNAGIMNISNTTPDVLYLGNVRVASTAGNESRTLHFDKGVSVVVTGLFEMAGSRILTINGPGLLSARGDVLVGTRDYSQGSVCLVLDGTGPQTLTGNGGALPILSVEKPSGSLNLAGTLSVYRNASFVSGDVQAARDSLLKFQKTLAISGSVTLAQASFGNITTTGGAGQTIVEGTQITVTNRLFLSGSHSSNLNGPGLLYATGDLEIDSYNYSGGSIVLQVTGLGNQTFTGGGGMMPTLLVAKPSGTLVLEGTLTAYKNVSFFSGEVRAAGDSTVQFLQPLTVTGSVTLANVTIGNAGTASSSALTIATNTLIVATNQLRVGPCGGNYTLKGPGRLEGRGDFYVQAPTAGFYLLGADGGSINLTGGANQTMTAAAGAQSKVRLPIVIDKTAGEVRLNSSFTLALSGQKFTVKSGALNLGTNDLQLTAANTDFAMSGAETELRATLTDLRPRLTAVRNVTVNGGLALDLAPGFLPATTNVIPVITAGNPVSGSFLVTSIRRNGSQLDHQVFYNSGGNNVVLAGISPVRGTLIMIR